MGHEPRRVRRGQGFSKVVGTPRDADAAARGTLPAAQRVKAERILELAGSGRWEGDLAEMRGDRPRQPSRGAPETGRGSGDAPA